MKKRNENRHGQGLARIQLVFIFLVCDCGSNLNFYKIPNGQVSVIYVQISKCSVYFMIVIKNMELYSF